MACAGMDCFSQWVFIEPASAVLHLSKRRQTGKGRRYTHHLYGSGYNFRCPFGSCHFYQPELFIEDPLAFCCPLNFLHSGLPDYRIGQPWRCYWNFICPLAVQPKEKPGQNYLQVLDRIVIVVALTGALIRLGNFFNSEIIRLPSTIR